MNTTPLVTLVFDGPHRLPRGGTMTRVIVVDADGWEVDWYTIDARGDRPRGVGWDYAPQAEHPERAFFGWPEGIGQPFALAHETDDWAIPTAEAAQDTALYEVATRLVSGWYDDDDDEEQQRHLAAHEAGSWTLIPRLNCPECRTGRR